MEDIHTALSGVLLRCSPLCIEALLKKWDKLPKECIRKVDFDAKKTSLVLQISELSEVLFKYVYIVIIIIMVIFKCYFSGELIALS